MKIKTFNDIQKKCKYSLETSEGILCNAYWKSKRDDGKGWAHFPKCNEMDCPIMNPDLLTEGGAKLKGVNC